MEITIDVDDPLPSEAGDAPPSIRQLAGDFGLDSKTVAKAYKLLPASPIALERPQG